MAATLCWFDTATRRFGIPDLALAPAPSSTPLRLRRPYARFSALGALLGTRLVIACGWCFGGPDYARGCSGEIWLAELAPRGELRLSAEVEKGERTPLSPSGLLMGLPDFAFSDGEGEEEEEEDEEDEDEDADAYEFGDDAEWDDAEEDGGDEYE